ncbi:C40 family peptidase [Orrella sp. JC864]|uniref:C40 family peptidase n=1 Tax=Orrella sp. JC864 TaxID=3120298 RepID=UPI0012BBC272
MPLPSHASAARRTASCNRRGATLAASLGLAIVLAGCAGGAKQTEALTQADDPLLEQRLSRFEYEADPIGALLRAHPRRHEPARAPADAQPGLAQIAQNYIGVKYRWGGSSPEQGFDCSGLVGFVVEKSLGLRLPRNAAEIARLGTKVDRDQLEPGDLVFFNTLGRRYSHVGIYVGRNSFVHAPSSGGAVRVEDMGMRYWSKRYNGARRLEPNVLAAR